MTAMLARQHIAEQARLAELARIRRPAARPRVTLRVRAGRVLLRWGTSLAPPTPVPSGRPVATIAA
jgi:hypothetical protein